MDITLRLKVKGVEIELTREDAKELRDALNSLVGEPKVVHEYCNYPWPYWKWPTLPYTTGVGPKKGDVTWVSYDSNVSLTASNV